MTPSVFASTHCVIKPGAGWVFIGGESQVHRLFLAPSLTESVVFANPRIVITIFYLSYAKEMEETSADPVTIYAALLNWANLHSCNFKISFMLPWMEVGQETRPCKGKKKS